LEQLSLIGRIVVAFPTTRSTMFSKSWHLSHRVRLPTLWNRVSDSFGLHLMARKPLTCGLRHSTVLSVVGPLEILRYGGIQT
jgi:hypothetical protein